MMHHRHQWKMGRDVDGTTDFLVDAKGQGLTNEDLFLDLIRLLDGPANLKIFFQHVKRLQNCEADALVNRAFKESGLTACQIVAYATYRMNYLEGQQPAPRGRTECTTKVVSAATTRAQAKAKAQSSGPSG